MLAPEIAIFAQIMEWCRGGNVALLQAYFDESERPGGLLCVAGFAFAPQQALKLAKEYRAHFGEYGGFHMKDVVNRAKRYKGISDSLRDSLVKRAVEIVKRRFSYGVAVTVNVDEFKAEAPRWLRGFKNPYPFLCHMAMVGLAKVSTDHGDASPITYFFEAGHPHESEAHDFVAIATMTDELRSFYRYSGSAFLPKAQAVPLQAADLLAWEMGKFKDETIDKSVREMRQSLLCLCRDAPKRFQVAFCGGESLSRALGKYRALGIQQVMENQECERQKQLRRNSPSSTMQ